MSLEAVEEYPRVSDAELARRLQAVRGLMAEVGATALVCYGADRSGSAIEWLSEWPVTREAALVLGGEDDETLLFVQHANHVPNAVRRARAVRVAWGGPSTGETVLAEVARRPGARVATIGPLPGALAAALGASVPLDRAYRALRLRKSGEEIAQLRRGAELTDLAVRRLVADARVDMTEIECIALLEEAYLPLGGTNWIHYFCSTPMAAPERAVPAQFPSFRRLLAGDAVVCEVSASYFGSPGQLLRTFSVAADPTPAYRRLHDVADEAFAALAAVARPGATVGDLRRAAAGITAAGCETIDELVHGFGGGYLPPIIPGGGRPGGTPDDFVLEENMAIVIQPNPVRDGAGVQTGELGVVTASGWQSLHDFPPGMGRIA